MVILPAIDLYDGECVRLVKGEYETASRVANNPYVAANGFLKAGAEWLHIVDLNGAKGDTSNRDLCLRLIDFCEEQGLHVEVGGGIRSIKDVKLFLKGDGVYTPATRIILGSAAVRNPDLIEASIELYGSSKIVVGIDAREGKVATDGWTSTTAIDYLEFADSMLDIGVKNFVFTDINTDGMLEGPNLPQTEELIRHVAARDGFVTVSGGIRDLSHIESLRGVCAWGAICGKSLYEGTLDIKEALLLAEAF